VRATPLTANEKKRKSSFAQKLIETTRLTRINPKNVQIFSAFFVLIRGSE
jgi:hypothetical protein